MIIDHNQAFDAQFDAKVFLECHVFAGQRDNLFGDMLRRAEYNKRFAASLDDWEEICNGLPEAWMFADQEMTVPSDFDLDAAYALLKNYEKNQFWNQP